jgi:hypothetical protein
MIVAVAEGPGVDNRDSMSAHGADHRCILFVIVDEEYPLGSAMVGHTPIVPV